MYRFVGLGRRFLSPRSTIPTLVPVAFCAVILWLGCQRKATKEKPQSPESGLTGVQSISITLGASNLEAGIRYVPNGDGRTDPALVEGRECHHLAERGENYIYFAIDPAFKQTNHMTVRLEVEFYAPIRGSFDVQYDGWKLQTGSGAYSDTPTGVAFDPLRTWTTVMLELPDARFENRQNGAADFRLRVLCSEFYVRRVAISRTVQTL